MSSSINLISGISIQALLHTAGVERVDLPHVAELCGMDLDAVTADDCWVSVDTWRTVADYLERFFDDSSTAYFSAGKKSDTYSLLGPVSFLPWFLSSPSLLVHNLEVVLGDLDSILMPKVEYIGPKRCRISLGCRGTTDPPVRYLEFLRGYMIAMLEQWNAGVVESRITAQGDGRHWKMEITWQPREYHHRRAMEELMVEPEFFSELYEGLRRVRPSGRGRFDQLLTVTEEMRGIASKTRTSRPAAPRQPPPHNKLKEQYLDLLTPLYDGILQIDDSGRIVDANPAAATMLSCASAEEIRESWPTLQALSGQDDVLQALQRRDNEGELLIDVMRDNKLPRSLLLMVPSDTADESSTGREIILRDPTFQSRYHLELGRTRQFLEAIFLNNPAGLQIIDTEGWTIRVNPRLIHLFKLDPSRIVGVGRHNMLKDAFLARTGLSEHLRRALKGEHVMLPDFTFDPDLACESPFCSNLNHHLVLNLTAYPLKDHKGHVFNVVVSYMDITENHLVQQQLAQIDKLRSIGTLTSGIAHDFNNILGAIVPNADLIMELAGDNEMLRKKAMAIKTASKRAASLTQQLVTFARDTDSDRLPMDLNSCVREAIELIGNAIPKHVNIDFEAEEGLPHVHVDALQMQQVLINLIINASDAMPKGGIIELQTSLTYLKTRTTFGGNIIHPGAFVELSITDHGTGIPQEIVDRVFDPFFTTKEKGRGTGLGLSIVHGIVKSHFGLIRISSQEGDGTNIRVLLPVESKP